LWRWARQQNRLKFLSGFFIAPDQNLRKDKHMNLGDIVVNQKGWQGEVVEKKRSSRFGKQCLVQYASRREWESEISLMRAVKGKVATRK
jgi:hypothetical protein